MIPSVELRLTPDGIECDWGRIDYGDPRPDRGEVGHLVLATANKLRRMFRPREVDGSGLIMWQEYSVTQQGSRTFIHTAYPVYASHNLIEADGHVSNYGDWLYDEAQRWTWELFPAHFADGGGPHDIMIGRWPD